MSTSRLADIVALVSASQHPTVVAIDGRSASGKTTVATALAEALNCPIVHTDDLAWHHSFFEWWPLLIEHILTPFRQQTNIDWTPEAWVTQQREGSIFVPAGPVLIVEGVGSSRIELGPWIDIAVWVEVDEALAEQRGLVRDGPDGRDFWFEWQRAERPFLQNDQPWSRAHFVIDGTALESRPGHSD